MIIDGTSFENIEKGLTEVFGIEPKELQKKINLFRVKASDGMCFYSDRFKQECYTFIANNKKSVLEEIFVYHLGRHITVPKELRPLPYLLTSKNSLTKYLALKNISFTYQERMLTLIYKGRTINKSEIYDENRFENHCRLAKRFGYFDVEDFCINGFGFAADIEKEGNSYFTSLQLAPELLQDLDDFLETDLCNDFNKISRFMFFR